MVDAMLIVGALLLILAYVFVVRIYVAYLMARNRYRDPLGWVLLSLLFSPLLTWIFLLIVGDDKDTRDRAERLDRYDRNNEWRHHDEETRYRKSSYEDNTH